MVMGSSRLPVSTGGRVPRVTVRAASGRDSTGVPGVVATMSWIRVAGEMRRVADVPIGVRRQASGPRIVMPWNPVRGGMFRMVSGSSRGEDRGTRVLAERVARVLALDVSPEMIELAKSENAGLENVEWIVGDGESLAGVGDGVADAVVSSVVFQHIPDPAVTLGYVREMGRVLRPGGVAAFQVSNKPEVHSWKSGPGERIRQLLGRAPKGQTDARWLGSAVDVGDLRAAAADGGMQVEQLSHEGTQYMVVRLRR